MVTKYLCICCYKHREGNSECKIQKTTNRHIRMLRYFLICIFGFFVIFGFSISRFFILLFLYFCIFELLYFCISLFSHFTISHFCILPSEFPSLVILYNICWSRGDFRRIKGCFRRIKGDFRRSKGGFRRTK